MSISVDVKDFESTSGPPTLAMESNPQAIWRQREDVFNHVHPQGTCYHRTRCSSRQRRPCTADYGRRPRTWANAYELSSDLREKQIQLIENKYGGTQLARQAATVIQHAYRQHCMMRNFARLRWESDGKRLSRRFAEFSRSRSIWSDLAVMATRGITEENVAEGSDADCFPVICDVMTHSYSADNMLQNLTSPMAINIKAFSSRHLVTPGLTCPGTNTDSDNAHTQGSTEYEIGFNGNSECPYSVEAYSVQTKVSGIPDNVCSSRSLCGQYRILSDSCESVLDSPTEPIVDVPSEAFEHVLEDTDAIVEGYESDDDGCPFECVPRTPRTTDPDDDAKCSSDMHLLPAQVVLRRKKRIETEVNALEKTDTVDDREHSTRTSPVWKRKSRSNQESNEISGCSYSVTCATESVAKHSIDAKTEGNEIVGQSAIDCSNSYCRTESPNKSSQTLKKMTDRQRKRAYRVGLNLFNKKPDNGIRYLTERKFLDNRPNAVARFLLARKGLSKLMIGEYLGNLQNAFNMEVLSCFAQQIDLSGLQMDAALRKFQSYFRMPGEAQKIERLMEAFANRYCECNPSVVSTLHSTDSVFLLAYAIIMLNTDLHNRSIKPEKKMTLAHFIRNLRGIDGGHDLDAELLTGIYVRIRASEFKAGSDHVGHVLKVEQMIVGKKPQLSLPHRRLVCYCRLYEVADPLRSEKPGKHQREVFLFNDIFVITKLLNKKKKNNSYSFRQSFSLNGMSVYLFASQYYQFGVRLVTDGKVLIMLNARNEDDQTKFVEDLKEAIFETSDMESLRIEDELKKQKFSSSSTNFNRYSKDSGVVDIEMLKVTEPGVYRLSAPECERLKKTTLSGSLIDISDGNRRASGASLDSGMQASAESGSVNSCQEAGRLSRYLALQRSSAECNIALTAKKN